MRTVTYDETKWKLVPVEQYMACEKALRQYTQAPENYHSAVLRMRDALRALINAPDHPATAGDAEDAARYRAWRDSACRDDIEFLDVMDQHISTANGDDDEAVPTPAQIDAAIDAAMRARKGMT